MKRLLTLIIIIAGYTQTIAQDLPVQQDESSLDVIESEIESNSLEFEPGIMLDGHELQEFTVHSNGYSDDFATYSAIGGTHVAIATFRGNIESERVLITDKSGKGHNTSKLKMEITDFGIPIETVEDNPRSGFLKRFASGQTTTSDVSTVFVIGFAGFKGEIHVRFVDSENSVYILPDQ